MTIDWANRRQLAWMEIQAFLYQVRGLLPGVEVPALIVHQLPVGSLEGWQESDLVLLLEHARHQLDRQRTDIEAVRERSQFLFSTCLAALGLFGLAAGQLAESLLWFCVAGLGALITLAAMLGAAGVVVARKELRIVDSAHLSTFDAPVLKTVAFGLAGSVSTGENTLATLITVYRDAVFLLIIGMVTFSAAFVATL